jgi:O-antigen ligase
MERGGLLHRTPEGYAANPGLLKKAESVRISATLFYPNALAGVLLLLLPGALTTVFRTNLLTQGAKGLVGGILGGGALACLYWSGPKAGWLLALILGVIALLRSPLSRQVKTAVIACLLVVGIVGFTVKYARFFQRGATSVVARFDYWKAGLQTAASHPVLGTGPGTFSRPYEQIKRPESEMARLTHNDYLQQASDSGWPGFAFYSVAVAGILAVSARRALTGQDWEAFAVWLGALGWALQGLVEFGLYIPALAWPAFSFLGWLLARSENGSTKPPAATSLSSRS